MRIVPILIPVAALLLLALPSPALAGNPVGYAGVHTYNAKVCGRDWVTTQTKQSVFHIYNGDFGNYTCITVERYHLDFQVVHVSDVTGFLAYPSISSGWAWGPVHVHGSSRTLLQVPGAGGR